jgi:hypothetical protein
VLPSLFQEQLTEEARVLTQGSGLRLGGQSIQRSLARLRTYNTGPEGYLTLVQEAKAALDIPVIASLNAVDPGEWVQYAPLLEEAGADAVELNIYFVATHFGLPGHEIETRCTTLVRTEDASLTDLAVVLERQATVEEINQAFQVAAEGPLRGILRSTSDPIVSRDVIGDPQAGGTLAKVFGWYDNEWGYTNRLVDLTVLVARQV